MLRPLFRKATNGQGIMGTPYVGVLASQLPTGFALPGLLNNDVLAGDPAGTRYREEIVDWPAVGNLSIDENGAFSFTDAPDGTYTGGTKVYKNDVADVGSYSFTIGSAGPAPGPTQVSADYAFAYAIGGSVSASFNFNYRIFGGPVSFVPSVARTIKVQAAPFAFGSTSSFWNVSNPKQPYGLKDPNSSIDVTLDWTDWLADIQDVAASFSWSVGGNMVKGTESADGALASVFVSAGDVGAKAPITCTITTASTPPRVEDRTVYLQIEER